MDFDKWYRLNIESNQDAPPENLWESIQDELDTDAVWSRLEAELSSPRKTIGWFQWSIAASLALLIGLGSWYILLQDNNRNSSAEFMRQANQSNTAPQQSNSPSVLPFDTIKYLPVIQGSITALSPEPDEININQSIITVSINPRIETILGNSFSTVRMSSLPSSRLFYSSSQLVALFRPTEFTHEFLDMEHNNEKGLKGMSLGFIGQYANTWQLNQKTFRGLNSQDLTATNATFASNFGIMGRALINSKTAIRAEVFAISHSRQNYHEYVAGRYSSTGLELEYISMGIMLERQIGHKQSPHWILGGLYAGTLMQATQKTNETFIIVKNEYSNIDFGIIAGYEYQFPLSSDLYLGAGAFTKMGLSNAFAGTNRIPDYMNKTRNAAFILSFTVNYSIK